MFVADVDTEHLDENMDKKVDLFFKSKGYKVKKSSSAKIIEKFEKGPVANALYEYLILHPSCRVFFNTLRKDPNDFFIDPMTFLTDFQQMLKISDTSFIYIANCICGAPLDKSNITNNDFNFPLNKQITCHKCDTTNNITENSYKPFFEIKPNDFLKFINLAYESGLFLFNNALECIYCNEFELLDDPKAINLECPICNHIRYVLPKYILDLTLDEIVKERQGYWLEWYVWRQLREFNSTLGKVLITNEDEDEIAFEVDGIIIENSQCILIECKDTGTIEETLPNLPFINEFADKWVLVATKNIKNSEITKARRILKNKFVYVRPNDADNVGVIIQNILKAK
ncbi:MAG: hypothetical protein WC586_11880 [Methanoregula sp.]